MALTMVHLLVADRWAEEHPAYSTSPEYYLGAVSPDAIHIRDKDDKSRKDFFHLHNWQSPHPDEVIEYWRENHSPFDIGYGIHVLTDCQWVPRYKELLPGILKPDGRLNTDIYYTDTFITDFRICREVPRIAGIMDMLEAAKAPYDHPLLTHDEFDAWRRLIVEMYRGECPKQGKVTFIDMDYVVAFANDCLALMNQTYDAYRNNTELSQ